MYNIYKYMNIHLTARKCDGKNHQETRQHGTNFNYIESFEPNLSTEGSSQVVLTCIVLSQNYSTCTHPIPIYSPRETQGPTTNKQTNQVTETFPMRPREELFNKPADTTNSPIIFALLERAMSSVGAYSRPASAGVC